YFVVRGGNSTDGFLKAVYADELNRAPDAAGSTGFSQQLHAGGSRAAVADAIIASPEGRQYEVLTMYHRFLRRDPDLSGSNAFSNALLAGMSDVTAHAAMMGSAEYGRHI